MKSLDDTWIADNDYVMDQRSPTYATVVGRMHGHEQALLAAAAPDLARFILLREWFAPNNWHHNPEASMRLKTGVCGTCKGTEKIGVHEDSCEWLRIMKKAGIR